jgi:hypothetical protein
MCTLLLGEGFEEVARRVGARVGVMGETGGRTGEADPDCATELGECAREL